MKILPDAILVAITVAILVLWINPLVNFEKDSEKGIQFIRSEWNQALLKAKKEDKLIFLNLYATWCGPCRKLKAKSFSDEQVGAFYNASFINVSLDGEDSPGNRLMEHYQMPGFPSLLFLDGNGNVIGKTAGYYSPRQMIKLGKNILNSHSK